MTNELPDLIKGLQKAVEPTDSPTFGGDFGSDPVAALAAKGLVLSEEEQTRLNSQVNEVVANRPPDAQAEVEVTVTVKVKLS